MLEPMDCDNVEPPPIFMDDVVMDQDLPPSPPPTPTEKSCPYQNYSRQQLIALVLKYKSALEKVYTKDQIDVMTGDDKRATYSPAAIEKSAHLRYVCGFTGKISYSHLRTISIKYLYVVPSSWILGTNYYESISQEYSCCVTIS